MQKAKKIGKIVIFLVLFVLIFARVSYILAIPQDATPTVKTYNSFYKEPENSLQVIALGNSRMTFAWNSVYFWKNTGVTSYNMSTYSQPAICIRYLMEETEKTQKDSLYIVDLNSFHTSQIYGMNEAFIRRVSDCMPLSMTKINMLNELLDLYSETMDQQIEKFAGNEDKVKELQMEKENSSRLAYYFPFVKYHSVWNDLDKNDFEKLDDTFKSALKSRTVFKLFPMETPVITDEVATLDDNQSRIMDELLSYIKENQINVLFVSMPSYLTENNQKQLNAVQKAVEDAGYPCINFNRIEMYKEVGLDFSTDFCGKDHVNDVGSVKVMNYLSKYLTENYKLTDCRGQKGYESWDEAVTNYAAYVTERKQIEAAGGVSTEPTTDAEKPE